MSKGLWVEGGPVVVITGATSGIGRAAALSLVQSGAEVVVAARDTKKAAELAIEVEARSGRPLGGVVECDLASFASVRRAAAEICDRFPAVHALLDNAGLIASQRTITEDGHELTFQVNHLSHFLLTNLLRPALTAAAPSRVTVVSSDAHFAAWRGLHLDDLDSERRFTPFGAYSASKLANIMFALELAERWAGTGVTANAMHPGAVDTGWGSGGWGFAAGFWNRLVPKLTPEQGADTLTFLALSPDVEGVTGRYFFQREPKRAGRPAHDPEARRTLWEASARMTGLDERRGDA